MPYSRKYRSIGRNSCSRDIVSWQPSLEKTRQAQPKPAMITDVDAAAASKYEVTNHAALDSCDLIGTNQPLSRSDCWRRMRPDLQKNLCMQFIHLTYLIRDANLDSRLDLCRKKISTSTWLEKTISYQQNSYHSNLSHYAHTQSISIWIHHSISSSAENVKYDEREYGNCVQ